MGKAIRFSNVEWIARRLTGKVVPIEYISGTSAPKFDGTSFYYTNKSGGIIHHPKSYGWHMIYHPSTRRIVMGRDWKPAIKLNKSFGAYSLSFKDGKFIVSIPNGVKFTLTKKQMLSHKLEEIILKKLDYYNIMVETVLSNAPKQENNQNDCSVESPVQVGG